MHGQPATLDTVSTVHPDTHTFQSLTPIKMPTVAAIVCNYNQKEYLEDAIDSVLKQTYPHLECVIVDDCSTDGSADVIRAHLDRRRAGRFRFIEQSQNGGQMAAMLAGLDATTAPFVAWLDADDIWLPQYIERHIAFHLNSQINAAISTSNLAVIDRSGVMVAGANPPLSTTSPIRKQARICAIIPARLSQDASRIEFAPEQSDPPVYVRRGYEPWVWSTTSGMVFRRAAVEAVRPLETDGLRNCADNYFARFSHLLGGTIRIGETLGYYRVHGKNHYATRAIYGDGAPLGEEHLEIESEGNHQFVRRLTESNKLLTAIIGAGHVRGAIRSLAKGEILGILRSKDSLSGALVKAGLWVSRIAKLRKGLHGS